jgi:hypothetical protein
MLGPHATGATNGSNGPPPPPCEPGVLDLGALVIVGLAAGRVGRRLGIPGVFVDTVYGIALSAAPAESIARSLATGLDARQVAAVLSGMLSGNAAAARMSTITPMFLDICERARWRCLDHLFATVRDQARTTQWESTVVSPIETIGAKSTDSPPRVAIKLRKSGGGGERVGEPEVESAKLLAAFKQGHGKVVFAALDRSPIAVTTRSVDRTSITVEVPEGARAGWIGLTTTEMLEGTRRERAAIREHWMKENEHSSCLRDSPVPVDAIAGADVDLLTPPRSTVANWGLRIIDVVLDQNADETLREGVETRVTASYSPASARASAEIEVDGIAFPMDADAGLASGTIPGSTVADGQDVTVRLASPGDKRPDDERTVAILIAAPAPSPGGSPTVPGPGAPSSSTVPGSGGDSTQPTGADPNRHRVRCVVVRPIFRRGDDTFVRAAAASEGAFTSSGNVVVPMPWIADEDLAFVGVPEDVDGATVMAVIERLENLAARTTGYEDAAWVAILPAPRHGHGLRRSVPSEVARALVVVSEDSVQQPITVRKDEASQPVLDRLRVVGRRIGDDVVLTEPARVETRAAGPGAAYVTELNAAAADRSGRDLFVRRIRTTNPARAGQFVALVPVSEEVAAFNLRLQPELLAVELRAQPSFVDVDLRGDGDLARGDGVSARATLNLRRAAPRQLPGLSRPVGAPQLVGDPTVKIEVDPVTSARTLRVGWITRHPYGIRPRIEIELGQTGAVFAETDEHAWTRAVLTDGATGEVVVPVDRLVGNRKNGASFETYVDRVRVVASDGWNAVTAEQYFEYVEGKPLLIRRLATLRYWADSKNDGPVKWSVARDESDLEQVAELGPGLWIDVDREFLGHILVAKQQVSDDDADVVVDYFRIPSEP